MPESTRSRAEVKPCATPTVCITNFLTCLQIAQCGRLFAYMSRADGYDALYQELGSRIARARTDRGLKQAELAEKVGVTRASIVNIERGRQRAPLHLLWQIAATLVVDLDSIVPSPDDLAVSQHSGPLEARVVASISRAALDDLGTQQRLSDFVRQAKSRIEAYEEKRDNE